MSQSQSKSESKTYRTEADAREHAADVDAPYIAHVEMTKGDTCWICTKLCEARVRNHPAVKRVICHIDLAEEREKQFEDGGIPKLRTMYKWRLDVREHNERVIARGTVGNIKPEPDAEAMEARYPASAAYLHAEGYAQSGWDAKRRAGRVAMERLLAGEDHEQVMADMEAAVSSVARSSWI